MVSVTQVLEYRTEGDTASCEHFTHTPTPVKQAIKTEGRCDANERLKDRAFSAVVEMREGPSEPACRSGLQTRPCCCCSKGHGSKRLPKSRPKRSAGKS